MSQEHSNTTLENFTSIPATAIRQDAYTFQEKVSLNKLQAGLDQN